MSWTDEEFLETLRAKPLIAILRGLGAVEAANLARRIVAMGVPLVEVTIQDQAGLEALEAVATEALRGDFRVGAGSVRTAAMAHQAIDAGASYLVSPGLSEAVLDVARLRFVPALPGIATPSELQRAVDFGVVAAKVFPAAQLGGPAFIRALRGPFPTIALVPTGGVNLVHAQDYFDAGATAIGVGGRLTVDGGLDELEQWLETRS